MEWAYELINGYKAGDAARDEHRPQQPQHRRADRQPRRLQGARAAPPARPAERPRRGRRRHRLHRRGAATGGEYRRKNCRRPDDTEAGNCTTLASAWPRTASTRTATTASSGAAPARTRNPPTQTYRGPGAVLRARVAQHPVARLPQPGDDADHQPHDRGPRAARARPGRARRPGRREPRLQGARRRDGQAERLLQPEGLRALRHHRHDRGLELQRHRRLRLHVRDLLRRARTTRPATATTPPSTRSTRRWPRSGTGTSAQADHVNDPGPNAGFDGKGNREAYYLAAESTINEARHSVLEGTAPAGAQAAADQGPSRPRRSPASPTTQPIGRRPPRDRLRRRRRPAAFRWHVNPSTRPIVAKETGEPNPGEPSPPRDAPAAPAGNDDDPSSDGAAPR